MLSFKAGKARLFGEVNALEVVRQDDSFLGDLGGGSEREQAAGYGGADLGGDSWRIEAQICNSE